MTHTVETVLILGNGLSRLAFHEAILAHDGPVWGCNRVFIDYGARLTAIAGHADVMEEARVWREKHGQTYDIFGIDEALTCPELYRKDTGSTLVAEALTRGYNVIACGFDLGGADVYSPGHEKKNKTTWVTRWRLIFSKFGPERVTFWGHDHKPFLLSYRPANEYSKAYTRGKAHLPGDYPETLAAWGNDYSRVWENIPKMILRNKGGRDWTFNESPEPLPAGGTIVLPEFVAKKYAELYRRDLIAEPLPGDAVNVLA